MSKIPARVISRMLYSLSRTTSDGEGNCNTDLRGGAVPYCILNLTGRTAPEWSPGRLAIEAVAGKRPSCEALRR